MIIEEESGVVSGEVVLNVKGSCIGGLMSKKGGERERYVGTVLAG